MRVDNDKETVTVCEGLYMCCTCVVMCINTSVFVVVVKQGAHKEEKVSCVIASGFLKWLGSPFPPTTNMITSPHIDELACSSWGRGKAGGQLYSTEVKGPKSTSIPSLASQTLLRKEAARLSLTNVCILDVQCTYTHTVLYTLSGLRRNTVQTYMYT